MADSTPPHSDLPSRTSIWAAAARALGARMHDPDRRNPDDLAEKLLGPEERGLIEGHALYTRLQHNPALGPNPEPPNSEVISAVMTLMVRTKYVDEKLVQAVGNQVRQVVIMGAGWDTRAHRFAALLQDVRVFEIDQPATQNRKRSRVREALGGPPPNLTYIPIDFRVQKLGDVLASAGYRQDLKTFFIWEGVTMYLPEAAVRETLQWVSKQASGTSIVFDFAGQGVIDSMTAARQDAPPESERERVAMERLRMITKWGEPWIFGLPENGESAFLREQGLTWKETLPLAGEAAAKRYLGMQDGQPWNVPIRLMYYLTEASV